MEKRILLDSNLLSALLKALKYDFPKISAVYIAKNHFILVDFVKQEYDVDTLYSLESYLNKLWPNNEVELLFKDFVQKEILNDLMADGICIFNRQDI